MIKIILCDDEEIDREKLRKYISRIFFDKEEVRFECYKDGKELVEILESDGKIGADIIFMDITMPKLDGMKTAQILRQKGVESDIIFVTRREDKVYQGYEVRAFAYLLKSHVEEKLEETIRRYLDERAKSHKQYLKVKKWKREERIPLKAIKYLISDKRKIRVVLEEPYETEEFYMKMSEVEESLKDSDFIRCHQSYLINMHQVICREGNTLILAGSEKIPLSRKYRKEVMRRLEKLGEKDGY